MYWYTINGKRAASLLELLLDQAGVGAPELFLVRGNPALRPTAWRVTESRRKGDEPELSAALSARLWVTVRTLWESLQ